MKKNLILFFILHLQFTAFSQGWFDRQSIDCTVLLEKKVDGKFVPHGTGFILYNYGGKRAFTLVTCEHVLRNKDIYVVIQADSQYISRLKRQNKTSEKFGQNLWELDGNNLRTKIELVEDKTFAKSKELDIAAFQIDMASSIIVKNGPDTMKIIASNVKGIPISSIRKRNQVELGTDVFFLGFPFLIGTKEGFQAPSKVGSIPTGNYWDNVSNPVLRSGTIGWISPNSKEFLIDGLSYGGNSGSPLFLKRSIVAGINHPYLVGMVIGHLGDDTEIQLNKEKSGIESVSAKGNAGLARCLWIDDILEVVKRAEKL